MSTDPPPIDEATRLLRCVSDGDARASDELLPVVYDELRRLAGHFLRGQSSEHTLQPTALVHEAYLRLIRQRDDGFNDRGHFIAVAATAMRQILCNHAKGRGRLKRGGDRSRVALDDHPGQEPTVDELLDLAEALADLTERAPRQAQIAELRLFGSLTMAQIAAVIGRSLTVVEDDWRTARAWLAARLGGMLPDA